MKNRINYFILSIILLSVFDLITKRLVLDLYNQGHLWNPIVVFENFLDITLRYNSGISFGLFNARGVFLTWLALIIIIFAIIAYLCYIVLNNIKTFPRLTLIGFTLIIGGALGNGVDRLTAFKVTDFMQFRIGDHVLLINNFADQFITLGVIFILIDSFLNKNLTRKIF